jgi:hypothetical protein
MPDTTRRRRAPASRRSQLPRGEWLGGRFSVAGRAGGAVFVDAWMDAGSGELVELVLHDEAEPPPLARSLTAALRKGQRPRRLRVADAVAVTALRDAFRDFEFVVAPTPEMDAVLDEIAAALAEGGMRPWLDSGAGAGTVAQLFSAAARLYRLAPWQHAGGADDMLLVGVPAFGIDEGWVGFLDDGGAVPGYLLFPTCDDLERYVAHAEADARGSDDGSVDFTLLALAFEDREAMPDAVRAEVEGAGWELAGHAAWPSLSRLSPAGAVAPTADDVRLAAACTDALVQFLGRFPGAFGAARTAAIEADFVAAGLDVHVVAPADDAIDDA